VAGLKLAIQQQLGVPLEQQRLSKDPALLTHKQNGSNIRWGVATATHPPWLLHYSRLLLCHMLAPALVIASLPQCSSAGSNPWQAGVTTFTKRRT